MTKRLLPLVLAAALGACQSHIQPMLPLQHVEEFVPDAAATQAAASAPATLAGRTIVKMVDPNQMARFVFDANYDNVWSQATALLNNTGFSIDRKDYRL